jgi:hypothetical protein
VAEAIAPLAQSATHRFLRSVRLDRDLGMVDALAGYTVTPQVQNLLQRLAQALDPMSSDRAWTVTGPYGTGKSACALFLAQLVDPDNTSHAGAWSILAAQAPSILLNVKG